MREIRFKAGRQPSKSYSSYRAIKKSGDLEYDWASSVDDAIMIFTKSGVKIAIDCNLKTGEFRVWFDEQQFDLS